MRHRTLAVVALFAASPPLAAQEIAPGFTRAQVEARLGPPAVIRTVGDYTYLFYRNGCEIKCGQHDLVMLKDGKVTDAVFRSPRHHYTGTSSAPSGKHHGLTARTTPIEPAPTTSPPEAPASAPADASQPTAPLAAATVDAPVPLGPRPGATVFTAQHQRDAMKALPADRANLRPDRANLPPDSLRAPPKP